MILVDRWTKILHFDGNPIPHALEDDPWREQREDTGSLLTAAGATTTGDRKREEASS